MSTKQEIEKRSGSLENEGQKVTDWDGVNKQKVRAKKFELIKDAIDAQFISKNPLMLSFAGAPAIFERKLVDKKFLRSGDIITVQDCLMKSNGYPSEKILKALIKTRDKYLPDMAIWPSTFNSFVKGYSGKTVLAPPVNLNSPPKWYKNTDFRSEMEYLAGDTATSFDVLDIDMCGPWSPETGTDIATLMKNNKLNVNGLLFINHLKGRDVRGGTTLKFLKKYFDRRKFIDLSVLRDEKDNPVNLDNIENALVLFYFRSVLVPLFYVTEAFFAGYHLHIHRFIEYRDKNTEGHGNNMMQWLFLFEAHDLYLSGLREHDAEYIELAYKENELYLKNVAGILKGIFPCDEYID
jgi:hypothetical protein